MLKVFLVEDEALIREGLRDKIPWEQYGYTFVGEATDGEMALPLIRRKRPDVLITDIKMPFMDGLSLSKIVREEFPKMKIIIISGHDDFEYAQEAISVGVDQYLLKPITRMNLRKVLQELREKIEQDMEKVDYQALMKSEMQEYEQFSRRRFFEKVLEGELSVKEIYNEASKQNIELSAPSYNLMFLYLKEKGEGDIFLRKQEAILHYFLRHPQYILFRWNVNCFGVLMKSEEQQMDKVIEMALEHVKKVCMSSEEYIDWHVVLGTTVQRLSMLSDCYQSINHYSAYRFILPDVHILTEETLAEFIPGQEEKNIDIVDSGKISPEIIKEFLENGSRNEIYDFVESYLQGIQDALKSRMFRGYVVLNIRFTILSYVESLGITKEKYLEKAGGYGQSSNISPEEVFEYFVALLETALVLRDEESSNQGGKALKRAIDYIDEHYSEVNISLGNVAYEVKMSANYLSSIFSQNLQKTFTEYVTEKRMERAKKLLRSTEKPLTSIAGEVGFKDSHYFSYVFKKTQGVSPREYRSAKKD